MGRWASSRTVAITVAVVVVLVVGLTLAARAWTGGSPDDASATAEDDTQSSEPPAPPPLSPDDETSDSPGQSSPSPGSSSSPSVASPSPASTLPAVPLKLEREADFGDGIVGQVVAARAVRAEASGPGEIAGPAIAYTIRLVNRGGRAVPLDAVTVNAYYGEDETPASPMTNDRRSDPFSGRLEPDNNAEATYLFSVPRGQRDALRIEVSHAALSPIAVFEGPLP